MIPAGAAWAILLFGIVVGMVLRDAWDFRDDP